MTTKVEFVYAQLDRDERAALAMQTTGNPVRGEVEQALREVRAKRQLLDEHVGYYGDGDDSSWPLRVPTWLALMYADRPEYLAEWAP